MTFNNKLHFCPFTCARVTIKTECLQMKNEYVTGIYETGVSSEAHLWLWFDCLQGEHRLMKQSCHFDYGYMFLWQTYIYCSSHWRLCQHTTLGVGGRQSINKTDEAAGRHTQIQSDPLKNIFILIKRACFLVEALWLVTRGQNYLGALFEMFSCDGARK